MNGVLSFLIGFTAMLPAVSFASSPSSRPLERLYKNSEAVIVGKVNSVAASCGQSDVICNRIYFVSFDEGSIKEIKHQKKSNADYSSICSNIPLEIDTIYTVFIEAPTRFNTADLDKCRFAIDFDGVFQKIGSYTYRVGAPDAKIIVDFEGSKYLTNAVVEPNFEQAVRSFSITSQKGPASIKKGGGGN